DGIRLEPTAVQRVPAPDRAREHDAPARVQARSGAGHEREIDGVPAIEGQRELAPRDVRPDDGIAERRRHDARRLLERVSGAADERPPGAPQAQLEAVDGAEVARRELARLRVGERDAPRHEAAELL